MEPSYQRNYYTKGNNITKNYHINATIIPKERRGTVISIQLLYQGKEGEPSYQQVNQGNNITREQQYQCNYLPRKRSETIISTQLLYQGKPYNQKTTISMQLLCQEKEGEPSYQYNYYTEENNITKKTTISMQQIYQRKEGTVISSQLSPRETI